MFSLKSSKSSVIQEKIRRDLYDAFSVWQKSSVLTFAEVTDNQPDILVEFHRMAHKDGYPFDGPGATLAHAFYPKSGIVHFDDDESWYFGKYESRNQLGVNLFDTAVHELGHTLGLAHSLVPDAIMFPVMRHDERYNELKKDEIDGIKLVYGSAPITPLRNTNSEKIDHYKKNNRISTVKPTSNPRFRRPKQHLESTKEHKDVDNRGIFNVPVISKSLNSCDLKSYDAIAFIRGEIFIFKNQFMWRSSRDKTISGPLEIKSFWRNLPAGFTKVDSVYETLSGNVVFFIGNSLYIFYGNNYRTCKSLNSLALPQTIKKVDAVIQNNQKTYIFAGKRFWE